MSHTWRLEIYHTDGVNKLVFADGDDVSVTQHLGLASQPKFVQERNQPRYLEVKINNAWAIAAWNVLSSSCSLWSSGVSAKVGPGMFMRYFVTDSVTGAEGRVFQGRIRSPPTSDDDGVVTVTAYDELMVLGETRDPFVVFANARDRIGDANIAGGPSVTCWFDVNNRIAAWLPDINIVQPLMRLLLAEPVALYDRTKGTPGDAFGGALGIQRKLVAMPMPSNILYGTDAYIRGGSSSSTVRAILYTASWDGGKWAIGSRIAASQNVTVPANAPQSLYRFVLPRAVSKGSVYYLGFEQDSGGSAIMGGCTDGAMPPEIYDYVEGWSSWQYPPMDLSRLGGTVSPFAISVLSLETREIPSSDYQLSEVAGQTYLLISQGSTSLTPTDMGFYGRFLRATYYYGKVSVPQVMTALANRAGLGASQSSGFGSSAMLPLYYTGTYDYLTCMRELADLYDASSGRQYTVAADVSGTLGDRAIKIGQRYKPWSDGVGSYTLSSDPLDVETSSLLKCISSSALKRHFEAKIGTSRYVGKAFDGSPIAIETDDRRWSAQGSLVLETGSPMQEICMDSTLSTVEMLAAAAEASVREQHVNHVEGSLSLTKQLPSILNTDPGSTYYGQSKVLGLRVPMHGLVNYPASATRLVLEGGGTVLEMDNARVRDTSSVKRAMDKALASESFSVSALPDTVYIHCRYPTQVNVNVDRVSVGRAGYYWWDTVSTAGTKVRVVDDSCGPDGNGYRHWIGFFPGNCPGSVSSYRFVNGSPQVFSMAACSVGDGTNWNQCNLDKAYYVWAHQNVVVDFRAPR